MQALLMAGGKGTRLRPYTAVLPKPLVPIGDISIIELVLRQLRSFGFERVIISVGHKAELIMAVIGDGDRFGLDVSYHREEKPLGTVGALAEIEGLDDDVLVMNGDVTTNLNFREIFEWHVESGAQATIGTYRRVEQIELGVVEVDEEREHITGFREKPEYDFFVSMGVNVLNRSVRSLIPRDTYFGFDMLMRKMLDARADVRPFLFAGRWLDIGRPDDYDRMVRDFEADRSVYLPGDA